MNKDTLINRIAHTTGCSRKEVLDVLKQFNMFASNPKVTVGKRK